MTREQAKEQRENCRHCYCANLSGGTFMLPYCGACILAKGILDGYVTAQKITESA